MWEHEDSSLNREKEICTCTIYIYICVCTKPVHLQQNRKTAFFKIFQLTRPSKQCTSLIDVLIRRLYLEKGFFCGGDEKWRRKISFFVEEREKEDNIWRRKFFFIVKEKKSGEGKGEKVFEKNKYFLQRRRKRRKIFAERKYLVHRGEEEQRRKRGNHLEKEN